MNFYLTLQSSTQKTILLISNIAIFITGIVALIEYYLENIGVSFDELDNNIVFITILALLLHLLLFIYEITTGFNGKYPQISEFKLASYLYSGAVIASILFAMHFLMLGTIFSIIYTVLIIGYYYIEKSYINSIPIQKNEQSTLVKKIDGISVIGIKVILILFDIVLFIICGFMSILYFFTFLYGTISGLNECVGILCLITTTMLVLVHIINIGFLCKKRLAQLSYFRFGHMLFAALHLIYIFVLAGNNFYLQIILIIVFIVVGIGGYFLFEQNLISRTNVDNSISQQDDKAYQQIDINSHLNIN